MRLSREGVDQGPDRVTDGHHAMYLHCDCIRMKRQLQRISLHRPSSSGHLSLGTTCRPRSLSGMVIRLKNSAVNLPDVLDALSRQTIQPDLIVGVNHQSTDGSAAMMCAAGAEIVDWTQPYHHPRELNFAVGHCGTERVLVLSSHTLPLRAARPAGAQGGRRRQRAGPGPARPTSGLAHRPMAARSGGIGFRRWPERHGRPPRAAGPRSRWVLPKAMMNQITWLPLPFDMGP